MMAKLRNYIEEQITDVFSASIGPRAVTSQEVDALIDNIVSAARRHFRTKPVSAEPCTSMVKELRRSKRWSGGWGNPIR